MSDELGFWSMGKYIWSYSTYEDDGSPFQSFKIMPQSRDQGDEGSCTHHAAVKTLEACLRLKRARLRPTLKTPELSIRHSMDGSMRGGKISRATDVVFPFLKSKGVTGERHHTFERPGPTYKHRSWCYRASSIIEHPYDWKDDNLMKQLFEHLRKGPFFGNTLRTGHYDLEVLILDRSQLPTSLLLACYKKAFDMFTYSVWSIRGNTVAVQANLPFISLTTFRLCQSLTALKCHIRCFNI